MTLHSEATRGSEHLPPKRKLKSDGAKRVDPTPAATELGTCARAVRLDCYLFVNKTREEAVPLLHAAYVRPAALYGPLHLRSLRSGESGAFLAAFSGREFIEPLLELV